MVLLGGGEGEAARRAWVSLTGQEELKVLAVDKVPAVFKVMSDCKVQARRCESNIYCDNDAASFRFLLKAATRSLINRCPLRL